MARLVATGIALLKGNGGRDLAHECAAVLTSGAGPLSEANLELRRYTLTDLRDDLLGESLGHEGNAVAIEAWHQSVELLLGTAGAWFGRGKWLVRQLAELDGENGTRRTEQLDTALRAALAGDRNPLIARINDVLDEAGGPLWAGFHQESTLAAE